MLTAGALALAVIAPALEPAEHAAEAVPAPLPATPEAPGLHNLPDLTPGLLEDRLMAQQRVSRSILRRPAALRMRPVGSPVLRAARNPALRISKISGLGVSNIRVAERAGDSAGAAERAGGRIVERAGLRVGERGGGRAGIRADGRVGGRVDGRIDGRIDGHAGNRRAGGRVDGRVASRVAVRQKRVTVATRGAVSVRKTTRSTTTRRLRAAGGGRDMSAVIAFARSQVGKRYVPGGEGPHGFDCSGFTKRAYAKAGFTLPHSSGGQARRARNVARSQARPGDLVVGPGHVGIYMGRGMMIDAGNSRTGVVYRKVYRGLRVARLGR
ncbi:NlpC/P60 family protein [Actinoplanes missouriensis]|uniref:C40 family peptidase n=1 Tax=Actinoplanes missouriensis TaxID=1866 RepID=UPI0033CEBA1C